MKFYVIKFLLLFRRRKFVSKREAKILCSRPDKWELWNIDKKDKDFFIKVNIHRKLKKSEKNIIIYGKKPRSGSSITVFLRKKGLKNIYWRKG